MCGVVSSHSPRAPSLSSSPHAALITSNTTSFTPNPITNILRNSGVVHEYMSTGAGHQSDLEHIKVTVTDSSVTFPNIGNKGDCMGDALRGHATLPRCSWRRHEPGIAKRMRVRQPG